MESIRKRLQGKYIYVVIAVVAIVLGIVFYTNSKSYEEPIKNYINGTVNADSKTLFKSLPEFVRRELLKEKTYAEYNDSLKATVTDMENEYGKGFKVDFKIKDMERASAEEIKTLTENIKSKYDVDAKVSEGYKIKVDFSVNGPTKNDTDVVEYQVYKINGTWSMIVDL